MIKERKAKDSDINKRKVYAEEAVVAIRDGMIQLDTLNITLQDTKGKVTGYLILNGGMSIPISHFLFEKSAK